MGAYLTSVQYKRLAEALRTTLEVAEPSKFTPSAARTVAREAYAVVAAAGKSARVDTFNGNFGLLRGLAAAFLVLFVTAIIIGKSAWILVALAVLFALALQRMDRFSRHYAIELFVQFLQVKNGPKTV